MDPGDDEEDQIAWRFHTKKGPAHGYVSGANWSLCAMAIWLSDQDKIDPDRRKCGLCLNVAKVRKLKSAAIDWNRVRAAVRASFTGRGDPDTDYCQQAFKADPARYERTCRMCGGSGGGSSGFARCPNCDGEGVV